MAKKKEDPETAVPADEEEGTEESRVLAEFKSGAPDVEDIYFKHMTKEERGKYGLSLSTEQLEEVHQKSHAAINQHRVEYALAAARLEARQPWRDEGRSRIDYYEDKLHDSYDSVNRHAKAVTLLAVMDRSPTLLSKFRYGRLAKFYNMVEKGVASKSDFDELEEYMLEIPDNPVNSITNKEFEDLLKGRFAEQLAALKDGDEDDGTVRVNIDVPAEHAKHIYEAKRLASQISKEEGRAEPSMGAFIVEAVSLWFAEMGQDKKSITAEEKRQALQRALKLALIPMPIHKNQDMGDIPLLQVFKYGNVLVLEDQQRHAAKYLGVKVEDLQPVPVHVAPYLIRTGMIEEDEDDTAVAKKVLEKAGPEPKAKKKQTAKKKKTQTAEKKTAEKAAPKKKAAKEKTASKKKVKLSELSDNEVSIQIDKMRKKLSMDEEEFSTMSAGKSPRDILRNLVKLSTK